MSDHEKVVCIKCLTVIRDCRFFTKSMNINYSICKECMGLAVKGGEIPKTKPCDQPCPKCGSGDIVRQFYPAGPLGANIAERIEDEKYIKRTPSPVEGYFSYSARIDFIRHNCRTCQYGWIGDPL